MAIIDGHKLDMSTIACLCPSIVGQTPIYEYLCWVRPPTIQFPPVFPFVLNLKHPNYRSIRKPSSPSSKPTSPSYSPKNTKKSSYNHHIIIINPIQSPHFCRWTISFLPQPCRPQLGFPGAWDPPAPTVPGAAPCCRPAAPAARGSRGRLCQAGRRAHKI